MSAMSSCLQSVAEQDADAGDAQAEANLQLYNHFTNLVSSLPSSNGLGYSQLFLHGQGWHAYQGVMVGAMVAGACFSHPPDAADHPFHTLGPHECIPFLELQLYTSDRVPDLGKLQDPRLFATHVPFVALPRSVVATPGCKVVYVCRDPKDTFVSLWHFMNKLRANKGMEPLSVEFAAEQFCAGVSPRGPYWEHVLGYWRAHLARPEQVLLFRYEEMQRDPAAHVRRLAEFVGLPFGAGEDGTADATVRLCAFDRMNELRATKDGKMESVVGAVDNSFFFRRGVVGDWMNHLSPEIAQRIDAVTRSKFQGSGLISI
ncbi:unnamed protein product [Miscanthus lutarioriparius]|uniref:Sulfotransferase n=1 Tax=Miscanthus lutarioriparius TaxID=422564 RepID=A0A811P062_9POAL|nr:unnamed protein product [Miscanthus lutarioriparius]